MRSPEFGMFLKAIREQKGIPQRKVAQVLDIDTSTLSKIELWERPVLLTMIKGLAEALDFDYKELQVKFISESILTEFHDQPFLKEALTQTIT